MSVLLVAHGTRNPRGVAMIGDLAARMAEQLGERVRVSFVDVLGPTPSEVLAGLPDDEPVAVVPAFLSRGYHVRVDIPEHLNAARHPVATLTRALGPSTTLARVLVSRLSEAGWHPGDRVILAAAGSSDPIARRDVADMADLLGELLDDDVHIAFAAPSADGTGFPAVAEVVDRLRAQTPRRRIAVASFLLADGLFQQRLSASSADVVARPLGLHPLVIDAACDLARTADRAVAC
ncbi:MAG: sirohydrochlorin chelatase [Gordonia sp. (in: high G+C Gram-positive bacteria)]